MIARVFYGGGILGGSVAVLAFIELPLLLIFIMFVPWKTGEMRRRDC